MDGGWVADPRAIADGGPNSGSSACGESCRRNASRSRSSSVRYRARLGGHASRDAGERRHLQAVALVRGTVLDAVQEHQSFAMLDGLDVHVGNARGFGGEAGELEVVRGEQREGTDLARR